MNPTHTRSQIVTDVIETVAKLSHVDPMIIRSDIRSDQAARARWAVFAVLKRRGWTYIQIAKIFTRADGSRMNHGTVSYGLKRARKILADGSDPSLSELFQRLLNPVTSNPPT